MSSYFKLLGSALRKVVEWRWWIVALASIHLGVLLLVNAVSVRSGTFRDRQLLALLIYGLAFPFLAGGFLSFFHMRAELSRIVHDQTLQRVLRQQLANSKDWNELTAIVLQFPRMVLPLAGSALVVHDPARGAYDLAGMWSLENLTLSRPTPAPEKDLCAIGKVVFSSQAGVFEPCACHPAEASSRGIATWCLPLVYRSQPVAILFLYLAKETGVAPAQAGLLAEIAPVMALAIEQARLERSIVAYPTGEQVLQHRLARYLHDTLGHNLAYLRLMLDQLSTQSSQHDIARLRKEIRRLSAIADQSYEQVRLSLAELFGEFSQDLNAGLQDCARSISERANFQVHFKTEGHPRMLPAFMKRQILFVVREALRNIEKHACARNVEIHMLWRAEHLAIEIADDGQGFDPRQLGAVQGHYGLRIIEECVNEMHGQLRLVSSPHQGTRLSMRLPLLEFGK